MGTAARVRGRGGRARKTPLVARASCHAISQRPLTPLLFLRPRRSPLSPLLACIAVYTAARVRICCVPPAALPLPPSVRRATVRVVATCLSLADERTYSRAVQNLWRAVRKGDLLQYLVKCPKDEIAAFKAFLHNLLCLAAAHGDTPCVTRLVDIFAPEHLLDMDKPGPKGLPPLHLATRGGHIETVREMLFELDADIDAVDKSGWPALHYVPRGEEHKPLKKLLSATLVTNKTNEDALKSLWNDAELVLEKAKKK